MELGRERTMTKTLQIHMDVYRKDGEDFDENMEDAFVSALIDVVDAFSLLVFAHMKVVDDDEDEWELIETEEWDYEEDDES